MFSKEMGIVELVNSLYNGFREVKELMIFQQGRVGLAEELFKIYKFRTMEKGRENEYEELIGN